MDELIKCEGCGSETSDFRYIGEDKVCGECFDAEMDRQQTESSKVDVSSLVEDVVLSEATDDDIELPENDVMEDMSPELRFSSLYVQELLPQVLGQDFLYGLKPNPRANHVEVTVQSLYVRSVNLRVAVPAVPENLSGLRRAVIQIANQLYGNEEKATAKLVVAQKKIVVPGR